MDATAFFKEIKNAPRRAYYLHGEEEYLKDRALEGLKALCGDPDLGVSDLTNPSAQEIIESCETLPFFCERRLVVVRELKTTAEKDAKDAKAIAAYLPRIPETTILAILERGAADKRKALFKAFAAIKADVDFAILGEEDAARFCVKTAAKRGCTIEPRDARLLVAMAGTPLMELNNELSKCCDYVGNGAITAEVINALVRRNVETNIFHMLDAMLAGRVGDGLKQLHEMLQAGEEPLRMVAFLAGRFRAMLIGKRALDAGLPRQKAVAAIGGSPFAAGKALDAAKRFTSEQLLHALDLFSAADADIKLSRQAPRLALECALLESVGPVINRPNTRYL